MKRLLSLPLLIWLAALILGGAVVARSQFTADMSAFLPKNPTAEQQLLVDQIKTGALSRTLLIGIEGGDVVHRAQLSQALAQRMEASGDFVAVRNGNAAAMKKDREILYTYRYLLSPAVTTQRFTEAGLRDAVSESIDLLASPMGMVLKDLLPHDPTGELANLLGAMGDGSGPAMAHGVWASRDGKRAILMAQTSAAGSDTDAQESMLQRLHRDFDGIALAHGVRDAHLLVSGSPVFSVDARATIRAEVTRFSIISTVGIVLLLLLVYRSWPALGLGLLPVATGALAGIAAVALGFGTVHGITVGFGTTLIGEAVDYTIYYFIQSQQPALAVIPALRQAQDRPGFARAGIHGATQNRKTWIPAPQGHFLRGAFAGMTEGAAESDWRDRFWPTIRLGVLTSVFGFASLLFSGFPGLAQLGLYSIAGLVAAAAVTRFVLPGLLPANFRIRDLGTLDRHLGRVSSGLTRLRVPVLLLTAAALVVLFQHRDTLISGSLSGLSPISPAALKLDESLRAELGAPDMRYIVMVPGADREAVLAAATKVGAELQKAADRGAIGGFVGFESPARYLPAAADQEARRRALPERAELAKRLSVALKGLPLAADRLTPFLDDVEQARKLPPLTTETLRGSTLALAVDALLLERDKDWAALLPLKTGGQEIALDDIRNALARAGQPGVLVVDLSTESNKLYHDYLREAILLSLAGFLAIVALLAVSLGSIVRLTRVLAPLVVAVVLVLAGLALAGAAVTLLHLVGLLLIVAVGSNYALFFDGHGPRQPGTLASLLVANLATVIGFGILAFSHVPVLHAMGITVGPGAILALVLAAMFSSREAA
ncbi:MAG TPA: MMPL family transporter [Rhodocyclaceae bacterium]|nr:MMPL family transporter [Rhodocyclaceae bacterium]